MNDRKNLLRNFVSLVILQGSNYILPLVTLPYLVRVLGPTNYGAIGFSQSLVAYFIMLTDYGFNLSATKAISIHREDRKKVSEIFSAVMLIKILFLIAFFLIYLLIVISFERFSSNFQLYMFTYGLVLGNVLFPVWLFQGLEKMRNITILGISSKLISTAAIFVWIQQPEDYLYVPLINSIAAVVIGCASLLLIFMSYKLKLRLSSIKDMKHYLIDGWYLFLSTVSVNLYTASNTFLLGIFTNDTVVGYYSSAEKVIKAFQGLISPVSQTIFPYVNRLVQTSRDRALNFIKKILLLVGSGTCIVSLILLLFSGFIVRVVLGEEYTNSIIVVQILSFLPFVVGLSNILGVQTMLTFNYQKQFSFILAAAGVFNVTLSLILISLFSYVGTAISVITTEIFVTASMAVFLYKKQVFQLSTNKSAGG
jgi:polysaccharide transporter, PST family